MGDYLKNNIRELERELRSRRRKISQLRSQQKRKTREFIEKRVREEKEKLYMQLLAIYS